jgi:hypothetical protein
LKLNRIADRSFSQKSRSGIFICKFR